MRFRVEIWGTSPQSRHYHIVVLRSVSEECNLHDIKQMFDKFEKANYEL